MHATARWLPEAKNLGIGTTEILAPPLRTIAPRTRDLPSPYLMPLPCKVGTKKSPHLIS